MITMFDSPAAVTQVMLSNIAGFSLLNAIIANTATSSMFVIYMVIVTTLAIITLSACGSAAYSATVWSVFPSISAALLLMIPGHALFISAFITIIIVAGFVFIALMRAAKYVLDKA